MPFTKIELCFIVRLSDQDEAIEQSHRFLNQLYLAGKPIFDSSVQVTQIAETVNAAEVLAEFERE